MEGLIEGIVAGIGGLVLMAVGWAATNVARRFGVELSASRQAQIEHFAQLGIGYAQEMARQWATEHASKMHPAQKLEAATTFLLDRVPGVTLEEAEAIVHAKLPGLRREIDEAAAMLGNAIRTREASPS